MNDLWNYRDRPPSVLADLGPLPHVVESDSDTTWRLFVKLQEQHRHDFPRTQPMMPFSAPAPAMPAAAEPTVEEVMREARRLNRICPQEASWKQLCDGLRQRTGLQPPEPITGPAASRTPPLVKRIRIRDQVEWAARCGQLRHVMDFFSSLGEEQWAHMRA